MESVKIFKKVAIVMGIVYFAFLQMGFAKSNKLPLVNTGPEAVPKLIKEEVLTLISTSECYLYSDYYQNDNNGIKQKYYIIIERVDAKLATSEILFLYDTDIKLGNAASGKPFKMLKALYDKGICSRPSGMIIRDNR